MKQKSINLLTAFLASQLQDYSGFTYTVEPIDEYKNHWFFDIEVKEKRGDEETTISLKFKVCYLDDTIWIETCEDCYEQVEDCGSKQKYFWIEMYFKK